MMADAAERRSYDVVYVVSSLISGSVFLRDQLRSLADEGLRVGLVGPDEQGLLKEFAASEGVSAFSVGIVRRPSPAADIVATAQLVRVLRRLRPACVVASMPKGGLLGTVAAWLARVPRRVYVVRGLRFETARGASRVALRLAEVVTFTLATHSVANSESLARMARPLSSTPIRVLGKGSSSGVDIERFQPQDSSKPPTRDRVCFIGRLATSKGVFDLVEAVTRVRDRSGRDVQLVLAGSREEDDGAYGDWSRSTWLNELGFVEDTPALLRSVSLLALPSAREGFPNVVLEAAACGIPVVTSDATGARDSVVPGLTGIRVPTGDVEALADAIEELLEDPERAREMGHQARLWAVENFDRRVVNGRWTSYIAQVVASANHMT